MKVDADPSLLNRLRVSFSEPSSSLQKEVDEGVSGFIRQATDWRALSSLTAGGVAYRLGRMGVGAGFRAVSVGFGLAAEVSAFELTHRALISNSETSKLWRWNGAGGIKQGLLHSLITFSTLKGAGFSARGENIIVSHLLQDSALVLGHQASAALMITPKPQGSLAQQFLQAEATTLQLAAGTALSSRLIPGAHALERGLDFSLRPEIPPSFFKGGSSPLEFLRPQEAIPTAEGALSPRPVEIFAMSKKEGEGGAKPPTRPKEVRSAEELEAIRDALFERFNGARDEFARQERLMRGYLTVSFARYADLITQWGYGNRDAPLPKPKRGVERPFARILNLVEAFAISNREMERILFEFRRWGIVITEPIKNTQVRLRRTSNDIDEAAQRMKEDLLPILDQPRLSDPDYLKVRQILEQLGEKGYLWPVPMIPHLQFLPDPKPPVRLVEIDPPFEALASTEGAAPQAEGKILSLMSRLPQGSAVLDPKTPLPASLEDLPKTSADLQREWNLNKSSADFALQRILSQYVSWINHWIVTGKDQPLTVSPEKTTELQDILSDADTYLRLMKRESSGLQFLRLKLEQSQQALPPDLKALQETMENAQGLYRRSLTTFQTRLLTMLEESSLSRDQYMTYRALLLRICEEHGWKPPVHLMDF